MLPPVADDAVHSPGVGPSVTPPEAAGFDGLGPRASAAGAGTSPAPASAGTEPGGEPADASDVAPRSFVASASDRVGIRPHAPSGRLRESLRRLRGPRTPCGVERRVEQRRSRE